MKQKIYKFLGYVSLFLPFVIVYLFLSAYEWLPYPYWTVENKIISRLIGFLLICSIFSNIFFIFYNMYFRSYKGEVK